MAQQQPTLPAQLGQLIEDYVGARISQRSRLIDVAGTSLNDFLTKYPPQPAAKKSRKRRQVVDTEFTEPEEDEEETDPEGD